MLQGERGTKKKNINISYYIILAGLGEPVKSDIFWHLMEYKIL